MRASTTLEGKLDRSKVSELNMNNINMERNSQTAKPLGPDEPIADFT